MKSIELFEEYCKLNPGFYDDYGTLMYTVGEEEMCEVLEKCINEKLRFQICYPTDSYDGGYVKYFKSKH